MKSNAVTFTSAVLSQFLEHHAKILSLKPEAFPEWYERYRFTKGEYVKKGWRRTLRRFLHRRERNRLAVQYKKELAGLKDGSWIWREYETPYGIDLVAEPLTQQEIEANPYGKGKSIYATIPEWPQATRIVSRVVNDVVNLDK